MSDDSVKTELDLGLQSNRSCPLWVISGHTATTFPTSAFGGKADVNHRVGECPLLAKGRHFGQRRYRVATPGSSFKFDGQARRRNFGRATKWPLAPTQGRYNPD